MAKTIDFYFDFSSPYGYLAAQKIEALAAKHGRTVKWRASRLEIFEEDCGRRAVSVDELKAWMDAQYIDQLQIRMNRRLHGI